MALRVRRAGRHPPLAPPPHSIKTNSMNVLCDTTQKRGRARLSEDRDIIEHGRPEPARRAMLRRRPPARITIAVVGAVAAALVAVIVIAATRSGSPPRESTSSQGPRYGNPAHPCAMLTMTTVTRYIPGALPGTQLPSQDQPVQGAGAWAPGVLSSQLPVQPDGECIWSSGSASQGSIDVAVGIYSSATGLTGAEQHFDTDRQSSEQSVPGSSTVTGTQLLTTLGNRATAIYANNTGNGPATPSVTLLTWSGNAEVMVTYTVPSASRGALLAAASAVTRDVLTALPRS
jgi:hypothetical protein